MVRKTRLVAGFFVFLLSCSAALAQSHATAPDSSAPLPAATTSESPEIRDFQKIEDAWADAINQRDQYALELVLSPLFVDVSATGDITTRDQQLAQLITGDDKTLHLEQRVITVRMLGDIAVANGTYLMRRKTSSAPMDEKGVYTHVYERAHGGWQCINSQRTLLRADSTAKTKKQSSGIDTPFHFPLFGKSN